MNVSDWRLVSDVQLLQSKNFRLPQKMTVNLDSKKQNDRVFTRILNVCKKNEFQFRHISNTLEV